MLRLVAVSCSRRMADCRFGMAAALRIATITNTIISSIVVKPFLGGFAWWLATPVNSIGNKYCLDSSDNFAIFFCFVFNSCLILIVSIRDSSENFDSFSVC